MRNRVDVAELEAAWRWVLRLRDEQATQDDLTEWLRWYQAEERNRVAFEEMQSFWHECGKLIDDEPASVAALLAGRAIDDRRASATEKVAAPLARAGCKLVDRHCDVGMAGERSIGPGRVSPPLKFGKRRCRMAPRSIWPPGRR